MKLQTNFLKNMNKRNLYGIERKMVNYKLNAKANLPLLVIEGAGPSLWKRLVSRSRYKVKPPNNVDGSVFARYPNLFDNEFGKLKGVIVSILVEDRFPLF